MIDLAPEPPDGCLSGVEVDAGSGRLLEQLAQRCVAGMAPLLDEPRRLRVAPGAPAKVSLSISDPSRCLRVGAVAEAGVRDLDLKLTTTSGQQLGRDTLSGRFALIARDGPVCLAHAEELDVEVASGAGTGDVSLQVWQAR